MTTQRDARPISIPPSQPTAWVAPKQPHSKRWRQLRAVTSLLLPFVLATALPAWAQLRAPSPASPPGSAQRTHPAASSAEIMYLVLLGEMQLRAGEAGVGYSLMLEAARKSDDAELFRRAVNIALQSRAGSTAVDTAHAWAAALPESAEPHRVLIQMLISMDRIEDSASSLEKMLELTPANERNELLDLVGQVYARAKTVVQAATVVSAKLRPWQADPATASSAYAAVARVQFAADMSAQSRASLAEALKHKPSTPVAGMLAADWLDQAQPGDEPTLLEYIERHPELPLVRMAYTRYLLRANRLQDSEVQLRMLTSTPTTALPEAWLILGALQLQLNRADEAETSFKTFLAGVDSDNTSTHTEPDAHARGKTQAYLSLAHIAERTQRLTEARAWLDRVDTTDNALRIQTLRASLLAREGKLQEARALIQATPELQPNDALAKLKAEAQLLKEVAQPTDAYAVLNQASTLAPDDFDLIYERAMLAEKLGLTADMEKLLRSIISAQPDNHNALNALGYALADRNERLSEAKALIDKAHALAPDDPFITDSLGWVLFRMGDTTQAITLLKKAFEIRQDVEIAVHLGEVLWTQGNKEAARGYFRQAQSMQPDNELLKSTLTRLQVTP